jgi:hypothetical protein
MCLAIHVVSRTPTHTTEARTQILAIILAGLGPISFLLIVLELNISVRLPRLQRLDGIYSANLNQSESEHPRGMSLGHTHSRFKSEQAWGPRISSK